MCFRAFWFFQVVVYLGLFLLVWVVFLSCSSVTNSSIMIVHVVQVVFVVVEFVEVVQSVKVSWYFRMFQVFRMLRWVSTMKGFR